ncbi:MAG: hypothetical protein HY784_01165 [Chloroflexi bacterium]|nr:hypothetical protein [Chloroflexota bacterium]
MRKLSRLHPLLWLFLPLVMLCGLAAHIRPGTWRPIHQSDLFRQVVYAYRQWQSTGVKLSPGDAFQIRASGEWQYSPYVGLHGPAGGMWAPDWYPLPGDSMPGGVKGGALLGRIGEAGQVFYVGARYSGQAAAGGTLYLRINDDLLGDNEGTLSLQITVWPAPTPEP